MYGKMNSRKNENSLFLLKCFFSFIVMMMLKMKFMIGIRYSSVSYLDMLVILMRKIMFMIGMIVRMLGYLVLVKIF